MTDKLTRLAIIAALFLAVAVITVVLVERGKARARRDHFDRLPDVTAQTRGLEAWTPTDDVLPPRDDRGEVPVGVGITIAVVTMLLLIVGVPSNLRALFGVWS